MPDRGDRWFPDRPDDKPYFCVVGSPVGHSRSPQIHHAFAAQFDIELYYDRVEVRAGELAGAFEAFRALGGRGMNVTVPLKGEAWELATQRSARAEQAAAANTLWFEGATACADNTDGVGLARDLEDNHGIPLAGQRILMLGAGGAARGVAPALLSCQPTALYVSNRTATRAAELAGACRTLGPVSAVPWGSWPDASVDIVINATALSLEDTAPPLDAGPLAGTRLCYDMMYGSNGTAFTRWAHNGGARQTVDGLGMLVEQAAEAFNIWHGRRPRTRPVIEMLRQGDGAQ